MDLGLSQSEQRAFEARIQERQTKEYMGVFYGLIGKCFNDCVNDFTTKSMSSKETGCVSKCVEKWQKGTERLGLRFAEQNAEMMEQQQGAMGMGK